MLALVQYDGSQHLRIAEQISPSLIRVGDKTYNKNKFPVHYGSVRIDILTPDNIIQLDKVVISRELRKQLKELKTELAELEQVIKEFKEL